MVRQPVRTLYVGGRKLTTLVSGRYRLFRWYFRNWRAFPKSPIPENIDTKISCNDHSDSVMHCHFPLQFQSNCCPSLLTPPSLHYIPSIVHSACHVSPQHIITINAEPLLLRSWISGAFLSLKSTWSTLIRQQAPPWVFFASLLSLTYIFGNLAMRSFCIHMQISLCTQDANFKSKTLDASLDTYSGLYSCLSLLCIILWLSWKIVLSPICPRPLTVWCKIVPIDLFKNCFWGLLGC